LAAFQGRGPVWGVLVLALATACSRGLTPIVPPPPPVAAGPAPTTRPPGSTPSHSGPRHAAVTDADLDALWARQLIVPVEGIARRGLRDNYAARREKGIHGALDILAPKSTPVLAATDCVIGRLFSGPIGGIVIYAYDPDELFVYYYAHLERYRRGLAVGDRVAKGSVIGYVGTTGNASPDTPHLHFQVMKRGAGRAWWDGPPINPFSFFAEGEARAEARRDSPPAL
jgi:murein DD-endopeptidase MepM/ murein hydrolase activator NlpD